MKIYLFILCTLVTTYNTYAYTCTNIIQHKELTIIPFTFHNIKRVEVTDWQKKTLGMVDYYEFGEGSLLNIKGRNYSIDTCFTTSGYVMFKYKQTNVFVKYHDE